MHSILKDAKDKLLSAQKEVAKYQQLLQLNEQLYAALDQRAGQEFETSISVCGWLKRTTVYIWYVVPAIPRMLPALEFFEELFRTEFSSHDYSADGTRRFELTSDEFDVSFLLIVSPDIEAEDATCRKVVVGEDTETVRRPRYEIRCD